MSTMICCSFSSVLKKNHKTIVRITASRGQSILPACLPRKKPKILPDMSVSILNEYKTISYAKELHFFGRQVEKV